MKGINDCLLEDFNKKIIIPKLLYMIERWLKSKKLLFKRNKKNGFGLLKGPKCVKKKSFFLNNSKTCLDILQIHTILHNDVLTQNRWVISVFFKKLHGVIEKKTNFESIFLITLIKRTNFPQNYFFEKLKHRLYLQ